MNWYIWWKGNTPNDFICLWRSILRKGNVLSRMDDKPLIEHSEILITFSSHQKTRVLKRSYCVVLKQVSKGSRLCQKSNSSHVILTLSPKGAKRNPRRSVCRSLFIEQGCKSGLISDTSLPARLTAWKNELHTGRSGPKDSFGAGAQYSILRVFKQYRSLCDSAWNPPVKQKICR